MTMAPLPDAFTVANIEVQVNDRDVELNGGYVELNELWTIACEPPEETDATNGVVSLILREVRGRFGKVPDHNNERDIESYEESQDTSILTPAT
jgi:hypothetical protein